MNMRGAAIGGVLGAMLAASGAAAVELRGHGGPVRALAVDPEGRVLTGSFDTRAILWDPASGAAEQVLRLHEGSVTAVAFLPDGGMVTGGQEGRIAVWRAGEPGPEAVFEAHGGPVTALAASADGARIASSAWDGTARIIDLRDGTAVGLEGHADNVNGVAFLPDGGLVTAGYDGQLRLWAADGRAGGAVAVGVPLNALAAGPGGAIWVAAADGTLRVFDPGGTPAGTLALGDAPLVALAVAEAGDVVAAGTIDGTVAVVEAATLQVVRTIPASSGPVWSVAFAADGAILAGGADNVVRPWDAATGEPLGASGEEAGEEAGDETFGDGRGAEVFRMCAACHTLGPDDGNRAGPTLHGIFGRPIATAEGFVYSAALAGMDIVWTPETVARLFEIGPNAMTPGTSMPEQRIADPEDRAALIEFLEEHTR
jgi:cytochrome c